MKAPERRQATSGAGEQLTLIDPPPFCPTLPRRGSLTDRALRMLAAGKLIDHLDFQSKTESWRLAAPICELRALGWPIETIEVPSPTEHCPSRAIALYKLDPKYAPHAYQTAGNGSHD